MQHTLSQITQKQFNEAIDLGFSYIDEYERLIEQVLNLYNNGQLKDIELKHAYLKDDLLTIEATPKNAEGAWYLLTELYGPTHFLHQKMEFVGRYLYWNKAVVEAEIARIEAFIHMAHLNKPYYNSDFTELLGAFGGGGMPENLTEMTYLILSEKALFLRDYEAQPYPLENSLEAKVYGLYFIFYSYLKDIRKQPWNDWSNASEKPQKSLTTKGFALAHHYLATALLDNHINESNCEQLATSYGVSPRDLLNKSYQLKKSGERTGLSENKKSDNASKKTFEAVLEYLKPYPKALSLAQAEFSQFLQAYNKVYDK